MDERMTDEPKPSEDELAMLADGSLPAPRQAQLRAQVQASPELTAALAEQQRAVTMLRALDQPAPAALRARIEEMTGVNPRETETRRPARSWRRVLVLPALATCAVVVAALVLLVGGGGSGPTVSQTAGLALADATLPAPAVDAGNHRQLTLHTGGIPFPNWAPRWATVGARTDTLGGRRVDTVYYRGSGGAKVGYSIVSGAPLKGGGYTASALYDGRYTVARQGAAWVVAWPRDGHTCVLAARGVSFRTLLALASGDDDPVAGSQASAHTTATADSYI